ncbi:MAG: glycosyltransferase family A protein [Lutibacter sp.]|uniref:glycosyltransferase family 2 protein n=1 Tax=Lutibacter sp. TaxID=1925666 RepID=UPI00299D8ED1|nr:glycosyltransferase family A protein [Lutibacter sp.]MDX1828177.1 glycosyltransferase family A protein [Lutibacter sp.]
MIVVYHKNNKITKIINSINEEEIQIVIEDIQQCLLSLSEKFKNTFIVWCLVDLEEYLNLKEISNLGLHSLKMVSFESSEKYYIDTSIGFIEQTPFIKVNKEVQYPTWLMSSDVGIIHTSVLLKFNYLLKYKLTFDFFLNTIAKIGIKNGLLCYSNPLLLKKGFPEIIKKSVSKNEMFHFIKSNYKYRWMFLFLFNQYVYKKNFLGLNFLGSFFKKKILNEVSFNDINIKNDEQIEIPTIDVLIPTLGREKYLKEVLLDLSKQIIMPKKVIIVEQNPIRGTVSKLDFLSGKWPFEIDHILIYQQGVCNARNLGLKKVTSDWVFLADDDIRFDSNLLKDAFKYINLYRANAINLSCLQKNETEKHTIIYQSTTFGSGTSIVNSKYLKNKFFDMAFEFGYGEDSDFGMQLRNNGVDILYLPFVKILHLKAPVGGFRKTIKHKWELETIQPKPSPTVMIYNLKHFTNEQRQGYRTTLYFKFYKIQSIKNPFKYLKIMNKRWDKSMYWANFLIKKYSNEF